RPAARGIHEVQAQPPAHALEVNSSGFAHLNRRNRSRPIDRLHECGDAVTLMGNITGYGRSAMSTNADMTMTPRGIALVGAPSSIGIRPYDDSGIPRGLDQAPAVLRAQGLADRSDVEDFGDVVPPAYEGFEREPGHVRNEQGLVTYAHALADRVAAAGSDGRFVLLLGGDCSIVLGALLGISRQA